MTYNQAARSLCTEIYRNKGRKKEEKNAFNFF